MKIKINNSCFLLVVMLLALLSSCRTEDDLSIDPPEEASISPNSIIADLMARVALSDGSSDNIVDFNSRIAIQLPITVTVNGVVIEIVDENGYQEIEDILDFYNLDFDAIVISYPITVILPDYTTVVVNSDSELQSLNLGGGNNIDDDDIECIDFQYPIVISYFDEITELASTITINNDIQIFDFIADLENYAAVSISFPITVILADGATQTINTIQELENAIETADNTCDEDDDNDFDDDDCNTCTSSDIDMLFVDCTEWTVTDLERNDSDLEDIYTDYTFTFESDGTISVVEGTNIFVGTWQSIGLGNDIEFIVNIIGLNDFNGTWDLDEYEQEPGEAELELSIGEDSLSFVSDCSLGGGDLDDVALVNALTNGDWYVTYFFDDTDETSTLSDYEFNFASDNTATAINTSGTTNGSWSTAVGDNTALSLNLNFGAISPLDELTDDWDVLEVTDDIIRLKDVSGGNGTEDFLTLERTPFDGGSITENLEAILVTGLWLVESYTEDSVDQTSTYSNYLMNFSILGTVVATKGIFINAGTWSVNTSENELNLNFGVAIPFNTLNNGAWDVIAVSDTEVVIQDTSGSTTNTLTLRKL